MLLEGKTSLTVNRANIGVLFSTFDENGEKLGDVLIDWQNLPKLMDQLSTWYESKEPKHYVLHIDPASFGAVPSNLGG